MDFFIATYFTGFCIYLSFAEKVKSAITILKAITWPIWLIGAICMYFFFVLFVIAINKEGKDYENKKAK